MKKQAEHLYLFKKQMDSISGAIKDVQQLLREMGISVPVRYLFSETCEFKGEDLGETGLSGLEIYSYEYLLWEKEVNGNNCDWSLFYEKTEQEGYVQTDGFCLIDRHKIDGPKIVTKRRLIETNLEIRLKTYNSLEQFLDEVPEMRLEFAARPIVGLRDIDGHEPSELRRACRVAALLGCASEVVEIFSEYIDVKIRDAHKSVTLLRDPIHRFETSRARHPYRRMRFLKRLRPSVHIFNLVMPSIEAERPVFSPYLHYQFVSFGKTLARETRIDAERIVLGPSAYHLPRNDAASRDHVEHGYLFCDALRRIVERKRIADYGDLDPLSASSQSRGDDVGRRHVAVGGLMMLVDADAVESQLFRVFEFVEVAIVDVMAFLRVVEAVWAPYPRGLIVLLEILGQMRPRHQMKKEEFHTSCPS